MTYKKAVEDYNQKIKNIWSAELFEDQDTDVQFSLPCLHVTQEISDVWFLGMNPSLSRHYLKESRYTEITSRLELSREICWKLEQEQREAHINHPYFKTVNKFFIETVAVNSLKKPVYHDVYPIRHTQQAEVIRFLRQKPKAAKYLLNATRDILWQASPKLIVVANVEASNHLAEIFDIPTNSVISEYSIEVSSGTSHLLFAGMLSGQRAMDRYSKIRLASDIRKILSKNHGRLEQD